MDTLSAGAGKGRLNVAQALALIHENFGQPLTVSVIARHAGLSAFHFSRVFRRVVGHSPHQYLTAHRMSVARDLLAHTDLSAGEIGRRIGYVAHAHFTNAFRAKTGMTPRAYRLAARQGTRSVHDTPDKEEQRERNQSTASA